jgi:hypothetical protein
MCSLHLEIAWGWQSPSVQEAMFLFIAASAFLGEVLALNRPAVS